MKQNRDWKMAGLLAMQCMLVDGVLAQVNDNPRLEEVEVTGKEMTQDSYRVEAMGTASKFDLSSMDTPQSVSAVTEAQMKDFALLNINSLLDNVVGVNVEAVETDRTYYTSRGFDITNFQVDGLGLPLTSGNSHGDLDTAIYERVEVVRGANGLMTGAGNPSATINMVRKRPTEELQGELSAMAGSWDNKRVEADVSGSISDGVRGRTVLVRQARESYIDWYALDKKVLYGIVEADVADNTLLTVSYSTQESNADSPMWGALTLYNTDGSANEYDVSTSSSNDWAYWDATVDTGYIELSHQFANGWMLKAAYTEMKTSEASELFYVYSTYLASTPPGEVILTGYGSEYARDEKQKLGDIYAKGSVDIAGREHDLVVGYSWQKRRNEQLSLYDFTTGNGFPNVGSLYDWDGSTPRPTFTDGERGGDVTDEQQAIYTAVRVNVSDPLKIIAGARVTDWETKGESYGVDQSTSHEGVVTPYLGAVYHFTPDLMLYGSYTEIFLPQTEIGEDGKRLDPIDGESTELGLKASLFENRLIASVAVFEIEQVNLAQSMGFSVELGEEIYREADGISSRGYELELAGQITDNWSINMGYTDLDIDAEKVDENVENYTPQQLFKFSTAYVVPALPELKLGASIRWKDAISREHPDTVDWSDPLNPVVIATDISTEQDAYTMVDLMAAYTFNDHFNLTFNINNATDEKYLTSLYWDQSYYGAPRNYMLTANLSF